MRKRILTGITTTGTPHIGNYLGAIKPALKLVAPDNDSYFFLADFHALIKQTDPNEIESSVKNVALAWLSSGLDPKKSYFYRQSDIPEVHELTWILNCSAAKGLLNRAHAYKAKVAENKASTAKLAVQNRETNEWSVPFVIEPSAGVDRGVLAVLNESYKVENLEDGKERTVLSLKPHLSPIKAAVIPLKRNNKELVDLAYKVKNDLQKLRLGRVLVENSGNIGKSYRRHDEVGTPICITIDFQTLEDGTVTIRDRDTMDQERKGMNDLSGLLKTKLLA